MLGKNCPVHTTTTAGAIPCLRIARSTKSARGLVELLNDAIESGIADLSDPKLKDRVDELRATAIRPAPAQIRRSRTGVIAVGECPEWAAMNLRT
jgi:hypothetical protein